MRPGYTAWREWLVGLPEGIPCALSDFQQLGLGQVVQLNADKLIAPFAQPMLVDGIRFRIDHNAVTVSNFISIDDALSFHFRAYAGSFALTNDFIPVAGLGAREQYLQGEVMPTGAGTSAAPGVLAAPNALSAGRTLQTTNAAQYTWRFDEPFYLPPGVPIRCSLFRRPDARDDEFYTALAGTVKNAFASATIYGRYFRENVAPPKGLAVPIPYATAFVDPTVPALNTSSVPVQVMSTETDLRNQTSDVLYAERMVGRLPARDTQANVFQNGTNNSVGGLGEYAGPEPTVRIVRTWGDTGAQDKYGRASHRAMVDPAKPFNTIFDMQSRAIEMGGCEIPPGEGFIVTVLKQVNTLYAAGPKIAVFPVVGMTGVREERW